MRGPAAGSKEHLQTRIEKVAPRQAPDRIERRSREQTARTLEPQVVAQARGRDDSGEAGAVGRIVHREHAYAARVTRKAPIHRADHEQLVVARLAREDDIAGHTVVAGAPIGPDPRLKLVIDEPRGLTADAPLPAHGLEVAADHGEPWER